MDAMEDPHSLTFHEVKAHWGYVSETKRTTTTYLLVLPEGAVPQKQTHLFEGVASRAKRNW